MEWHVTIFGDLEFPPGGVDRWRALSPDPEAHGDAADLGGAALGRAKVSEVLGALASLHDKPGAPGRVDVTVSEAGVKVRGFLIDVGYRAWLGQAVSTLRAASEAGARGVIYVVHIDGELAYEVAITPKGSKVTAIKGHKKIERIDRTPAGEEATALYRASFGATKGSPPGPATGEAASEVSRAIAAKLAERPAGEVHKALLARDPVVVLGPGRMSPTKEAFPSPASFSQAIKGLAGDDPLTAIALDLLVKLDPKGAAPLAMRALSARVGPQTLAAAAKSMTKSAPEGAAAALLDAIDVPPLDGYNPGRDQVVATLKALPDKRAGAEALARITPALLDRPDAASVITALLDAAEARSTRVPEGLWIELFRRRSEPLLRVRAARALLENGGHEALATLATAVGERAPLGGLAVRALFALDPAKAHDTIAPRLSGDLARDPAKTIADDVISYLYDDVTENKAKSIALKDPRWVDLALRAPAATGAVLFLGYTRDARVAPALAALLADDDLVEDICASLKRIGDPSVVPALEAALPKALHPYTKKLIKQTIEKLSGRPAAPAKAPSSPAPKSKRSAKK